MGSLRLDKYACKVHIKYHGSTSMGHSSWGSGKKAGAQIMKDVVLPCSLHDRAKEQQTKRNSCTHKDATIMYTYAESLLLIV